MTVAAEQSTYLVVGANRGIGYALVDLLSQTSDNIVFATTRNLESKASAQLIKLSEARKNLHVLPTEVTQRQTIIDLASQIEGLGFKHLNHVIYNAGALAEIQPLIDVTRENYLYGIEVNTLGAIYVYQAFAPFFANAKAQTGEDAVFISISSKAGMTSQAWPIGNITYTSSKALLNHVSAQINLLDNVTAIAVHPGLVDTDMAAIGSKSMGYDLQQMGTAFNIDVISTKTSAEAIVKILQSPDVAQNAGKFLDYSGEELPL